MSRRTFRVPDAKREKFLEGLASGATIRRACEGAGVSRSIVFDWRKSDEQFAERWQEAYEEGSDRLEEEARRRGVEGVRKPVYQGGQLVGEVVEYSDRMLELLLKARRPERFRERYDVRADVAVGPSAAHLTKMRALGRDPEMGPALEALARAYAENWDEGAT